MLLLVSLVMLVKYSIELAVSLKISYDVWMTQITRIHSSWKLKGKHLSTLRLEIYLNQPYSAALLFVVQKNALIYEAG